MELYKEYVLTMKKQRNILLFYFVVWLIAVPVALTMILDAIGMNQTSLLLFIHYLIGALLFLYLGKDLLKSETSFPLKKAISSVLIGIALLFALNIVFNIIYLSFFNMITSENQKAAVAAQLESPILSFLSIAILAPIVEEIVFRGVIFRSIRRKQTFLIAALISGFVFGLLHVFSSLITGNFLDVLYLFLYGGLGVVFAKTYEDTKSIYPCIVLHGVYNAIGFLLSLM